MQSVANQSFFKNMSKVSVAFFVFVFSFSFISSTPLKKKDEDFDFFDIFSDLFGLGSDEDYSFENKTVTSKF